MDESPQPNLYACILAGGSGERFWPLSRAASPKHLTTLLSEETLLAATVRRVARAVAPERIFVLTQASQVEACRAVLPQLAATQIVAEPMARDTAAACAFGTALVRQRDPEAVVAFLPADALVHDEATFGRQLAAAAAVAAAAPTIVTFGIPPTQPATRFGYLETGAPLPQSRPDRPLYQVIRFTEKPDRATAEAYLAGGRHLWNGGIFLWRSATFLREARRLRPALADFIEAFSDSATGEEQATRFAALPKISLDYAIMERAESVVVLEAKFDWDDVGSWTALPAHLPGDAARNTVRGTALLHESTDNIVVSTGRTVALCGVHDLIVVETADAVLVCHRDHAESLKKIYAQLPTELK